ncbi:MAG: NAD-dependent epimerase/dehydratase family protein [Thermoproteota archaeon]|nr:NAD-dependent epimerase/dehydratase family protein [Thermoproteota archaeon]
MNILVLGIDGYIGWALAMHLAKRGHVVSGIDNFARRANVASVGSHSATPILEMHERIKAFKRVHDKNLSFFEGDLLDYDFLADVIKQTRPDSIVHLAEQPSAPFSMIDRKHAIYSQHNNIEGTLNVLYAMKDFVPECHLVKLGTMGEYGTPNIDIPEGFFEVDYRGRKDTLPFPRQPGSMYHLSKVHDSANVMFACRVWKLCSTDIMQGVVYGTRTDEIIDDSLMTRFDFDESFGTVINRYCAEAVIGLPLTPYGQGKQKRGFIDLVDSVQCLTIAIENPPIRGEYRVFNQLDQVYSIAELADRVVNVAKKLGMDVKIKNLQNPRVEKEGHYYKVDHERLRKLGFKPTRTVEETIEIMLKDLSTYKDRVVEKRDVILPKTTWYKTGVNDIGEPPSALAPTPTRMELNQ